MTLKKMLFLAAILAAMALYITKVELSNDEIKHTQEQPLEKLVPQSIAEISIAGEKGTFQLVNPSPVAAAGTPAPDASVTEDEAKQWKVQGVDDSGLERGALNTLISSLKTLKLENGLAADDTEKDLGVYGLAKPELTVSVKAEGAARSFQFGKMNEYVNKRYIKDAAEPVIYLATNELFTAASKAAADFRDHMPVKLKSESLAKFSVASPSGKFVLEQKDGSWKLIEPGPFTANTYIANGLVRELVNTRATSFIDGAAGKESEYGLAKPMITIVAEPSGEPAKPVTVNFGFVSTEKDSKKSLKFYMQVAGKSPIFEIGGDPTSRLVKTVKELREKQLFRFASDRIKEVRIEHPGSEDVVLTKSDSGWTVNGKGADAPFVSQFLTSVTEVSAFDFPEQGANLGFDTPSAKVTCTLNPESGKDAEEKKVLVFGKKFAGGTGGYGAIVEGSSEPFIVTAETYKSVTPWAEALLKSETAPEETPAAGTETPAATPQP